MDGIKLTYEPLNGVYIKGMIGKQRYMFVDGLVNGNGIVRAIDGEFNLNELFETSEIQSLRAPSELVL